MPLFEAVQAASREWEGAYAVGFISSREPDVVVGARKGSPLLVGLGQGENFLASDASALIARTRDVIYLEEGDVVEVRPDGVSIRDGGGRPVERAADAQPALPPTRSSWGRTRTTCRRRSSSSRARSPTRSRWWRMRSRCSPICSARRPRKLLPATSQVLLLACGTSYHAGLVARYWLEAIAGVARGGRDRERVSLPRSGGAARHAGRDDLPVGRDRGYDRGAEARPGDAGSPTR